MTENEFDQQIRKRAIMREDESSDALWGKEELWKRIENSMTPVRRKVLWWPAAAIFFLFLLSSGWSVAQYFSNEKYKEEKELETWELKESIRSMQEGNNLLRNELEQKIIMKDEQIESLQEMFDAEVSRLVIVDEKPEGEQAEIATLKKELDESEELINELKSDLLVLKEQECIESNNAVEEIADTSAMQMKLPDADMTSTRIYYLTSPSPEKTSDQPKGLSIKFFGNGKSTKTEYKSETNFFSK